MLTREHLERFDERFLRLMSACTSPFARIALFLVFFWFGALKVFYTSPANPLVAALLERTLPFMDFDTFIVLFGVYEMVIGLAFLIPRWERAAIALLLPHMVMTMMPMVLLPQVAWEAPLVPTLEGQYMLKNLVIIALAFSIAARLYPSHRHE